MFRMSLLTELEGETPRNDSLQENETTQKRRARREIVIARPHSLPFFVNFVSSW